MAYQGHIVIPTEKDGANEVVVKVQNSLVVSFGGCSSYEGRGLWDGANGVVTEDHVRLVVDTDEMDREAFTEFLRIEALRVKEELDEEAVLIEVQEINMELV